MHEKFLKNCFLKSYNEKAISNAELSVFENKEPSNLKPIDVLHIEQLLNDLETPIVTYKYFTE